LNRNQLIEVNINHMSLTSQHLDDLSEEFGEYIGSGKEVGYDENYNVYFIKSVNEDGTDQYDSVTERFLPAVSRYMN